MSLYPFWSFNFEVRPDLDAATLRVLGAVAADVAPETGDLTLHHPVARYHLADWHRLLTDEDEPFVGPPIRLSRDRRTDHRVLMSIEFSQHDDEFANGGWIFWTWVLRLIARPEGSAGRSVIGYHGVYRNDYDTKLIYLDSGGVTEADQRITFDELDSSWRQLEDDDRWEGWQG